MQTFTGWEYICIDVANQFGHDKLLFPERIQWVHDNLENLEALTEQADKKTQPLYIKAVMALRKAQRGEPTGHMVGFDATCSGIQIMSTITDCESGARATGLIDPNRRADAYTDTTAIVNQILTEKGLAGVNILRKRVKNAVMTAFYGSTEQPKKEFGEDTPELAAFYEAVQKIAPGAYELLHALLASWQPFALAHAWKLPDGFDARVKVEAKKEPRIQVDELGGASFTYVYYENQGTENGLSNVANVVHSIDAYVLRCLIRRCSYDPVVVNNAQALIQSELLGRDSGQGCLVDETDPKVEYYIERYEATNMADIVILPYLNWRNIGQLSNRHLYTLMDIINSVVVHKPFPIQSVHDEFKCHANNMNHLRQHYINIFAELADSIILDDIFTHLYGQPGQYAKLSNNLSAKIRQSNYALS